MKAFDIISHPFTLIASFFLILISGEHVGGFYLFYILMALPHGGLHAILAMTGILVLVACYVKFKRENKFTGEAIINILGEGCLVASLFVFFYNDPSGYNTATLTQRVPQLTLLLFGVLAICFALYNITRTIGDKLTGENMRKV